jgi:hypothetical protein
MFFWFFFLFNHKSENERAEKNEKTTASGEKYLGENT